MTLVDNEQHVKLKESAGEHGECGESFSPEHSSKTPEKILSTDYLRNTIPKGGRSYQRKKHRC